MRKFLNKILSYIAKSVHHKKGGKISSGRVSSYAILFVIIIAALTFVGIDIANAVIALMNKGFYEIPANHIVLYGMTLAHHLSLLSINKSSERKVEVAVQEKLKALNQLNPKDIDTTPPGEPVVGGGDGEEELPEDSLI